MRLLKLLTVLLVASVAGLVGTYVVAGSTEGPTIVIDAPPMIGRTATLRLLIDVPRGRLDALRIAIVQQGRTLPLEDDGPEDGATTDGPDRIVATRAIGATALPGLRPGRATIVVTASRPLVFGLRSAVTTATREVEVRLDPPKLSVRSTFHYVNQGGSEFIVYRVDPPDAASGVAVGDLRYPGFSLSAAGLSADPTLRGAFFALLHDQAPDTPIGLYATDPAGNQARAAFEHRVFPKRFQRSRIAITDAFLAAVVPAITAQALPESRPASDGPSLLASFLAINGALRRENAETIAAFAAQTTPTMLWRGAFERLSGSTESGFADSRTYFYGGREIDRQVHLGFDLARTVNTPVGAANHGVVLYAGPLGIYGNTVIIDHGLGVQSLYAHLSSFEVREEQRVERGDMLGRTGQTGLAAGDHLHFSMLVNGQFVNAVEWWDPHWIEDRIQRKLRLALDSAEGGRR